jgi:hypothetical protein
MNAVGAEFIPRTVRALKSAPTGISIIEVFYLGFSPNFRNKSYIVGRLTPSNSAACDIFQIKRCQLIE